MPCTLLLLDRFCAHCASQEAPSGTIGAVSCIAEHETAYLHLDDVLLSLGSLLASKLLGLSVQALLEQGQGQLSPDGRPRVITGHIDELGFQVVQHRPPILQPLLGLLQLRLDPLEELAVVVVAVQLTPHILTADKKCWGTAALTQISLRCLCAVVQCVQNG